MTIKMKISEDKEAESHNEETRVQVFVQQMLITRVFAASYVGRFYVNTLNTYRDVIKIYEEEKDLIRDLEVVNKRITNFYQGVIWTAITGPDMLGAPSGHSIWVTLQNVPLGVYWFMIEAVSFSGREEVVVKVKVIRKFEPDATNVFQKNGSVNWIEMKNNIFYALQETVTMHNIKESTRFIFLLLVAIGTGLVYGIQYIADYSIRFFKEFNNLIKVCTPIFIAILDLISKTIGGFYILIAMMWRGGGQVPPQFPSIKAPSPRQYQPFKSPPHQRRRAFNE